MDKLTFDPAYLSAEGFDLREVIYMLNRSESVEIDQIDSRRGNGRVMIIGFDPSGDIIEAGLEQMPDGHYHLYHVRRPATLANRRKFGNASR